MPLLEGVDVVSEVRRARVPAHIARRPKLATLRTEALAMIEEMQLVEPRAVWRIVALDGEPGQAGWLCLDGKTLQAPWLVPASGELTGVACAVATLGPRIEQQVGALFEERRPALAVALDAVANELLFALSRRVQDRMFAGALKQGLSMAGELRAGDPGLALSAQEIVLALAGAEQIGVSLTRTMMMTPSKSTSIVQGVGRELPAAEWSRCDQCPSRARCRLVKEPA